MTSSPVSIETADDGTIDRVTGLLEANGLPSEDVRANPDSFFLAYAESGCIGTGGVEIHGSSGLLRSVVITEPNRGRGYGSSLCDALEDYARANEVDRLYLLTTSAAPFFRGRGYEAIERTDAPSSIRRTTEFADLCPSSTICMRKDL